MAKRRREILPQQENQNPSEKQQTTVRAWAMTRKNAAYQIVEFEIDLENGKISTVNQSEGNRQTIQLQRIEDAMLRQAHHGW